MELTEEVLKSIRQQATDASTTGTNFPQGADDVTTLAMVEEIERLRAVVAQQATENAALRTALQTIEVLMSDISDDEQLRRAMNSAANAGLLDAKPDAAPAPVEPAAVEAMPEIKKGDKVGVIRAHGHGDKKLIGLEGIVTEVRDGEELTYRYTVKIGERRHLMARDQIIPLSAD